MLVRAVPNLSLPSGQDKTFPQSFLIFPVVSLIFPYSPPPPPHFLPHFDLSDGQEGPGYATDVSKINLYTQCKK